MAERATAPQQDLARLRLDAAHGLGLFTSRAAGFREVAAVRPGRPARRSSGGAALRTLHQAVPGGPLPGVPIAWRRRPTRTASARSASTVADSIDGRHPRSTTRATRSRRLGHRRGDLVERGSRAIPRTGRASSPRVRRRSRVDAPDASRRGRGAAARRRADEPPRVDDRQVADPVLPHVAGGPRPASARSRVRAGTRSCAAQTVVSIHGPPRARAAARRDHRARARERRPARSTRPAARESAERTSRTPARASVASTSARRSGKPAA